jgi:hypothetical protein
MKEIKYHQQKKEPDQVSMYDQQAKKKPDQLILEQ